MLPVFNHALQHAKDRDDWGLLKFKWRANRWTAERKVEPQAEHAAEAMAIELSLESYETGED